MFLDYGFFPPEFNSIRLYTGVGSGPLLTASAAWDQLALELTSAASSYQGVVNGLAAGWQGPAAAQMEQSAAPYITWMNITAAQAEQVASQAKLAATAFETAHAAMVPPPVIAANRSLLMSLVATNLLGQNTPAIMATEVHYLEMWAQCAAAMYGYAGSATQAMVLPKTLPPKPNTNPLAAVNQGAAVSNASAQSAAGNVQAVVSQVNAAAPAGVQQVLKAVLPPMPTSLKDAISTVNPYLSLSSSPLSIFSSGASVTNSLNSIAKSLMPAAALKSAVTAASGAVSGAGPGLFGTGTAGLSGLNATAGLGRAASLSGLSVPQAWGTLTQAVSPPTAVLPNTASLASAVQTTPNGMFGGVPMASLGARAAGNAPATPGVAIRPELSGQMLRPVVGG